MDSRDERANLRRKISLTKMLSVSLSLNVPGFPKSNETTQRFFGICLNDLKLFLQAHRIVINNEDALCQTDAAGDFFIAPISLPSSSPAEIKQMCETFEEMHPLGRFLDADITDNMGNPVSSGKSKPCFFCHQKPASVCRYENAHDVNELRHFMFSKMSAFCNQYREDEICRKLQSLALKAMLYEISLTPKPGLVDKINNGSHSDMNYQTFIDSSVAISVYFADLVHAGFTFQATELNQALPVIRKIGLRMEADMYAATHHVNTQKGLIFLMGISLFACGTLFARQEKFDAEQFKIIVKQICKDIIHAELRNQVQVVHTHGETVFGRHALSGARGEAEQGFPMVFKYGLPELLKYRELNDEALQRALLSIAAHNMDTNIIYRTNPEVLGNFQKLSADALNQFSPESYANIIEYCARQRISPGGTADLLSVSLFIYLVITSDEKNELAF